MNPVIVNPTAERPTDADTPAEAIASKLERLRVICRSMESILVCFSGGIDSALVLAVATAELGPRAVGMTAVSPSLPERERLATQELARLLGARHELVSSGELSREGYQQNGPDRCYHCKTELYEVAERKRADWNLAVVANGTNLDDLGDYRPGLEAARVARARSPLVEAEFNKADVRAVSRLLGLPIWDKPASACLSSRIPYGTTVTVARLHQVEALEVALQDLGFHQVRVRYHDTVARIELPPEDLPRLIRPDMAGRVTEAARAAGFQFAAADLLGYRQGALNEMLPGRRLKVLAADAPHRAD